MEQFIQNLRDTLIIFACAVVIVGQGGRALLTLERAIQNISQEVSN